MIDLKALDASNQQCKIAGPLTDSLSLPICAMSIEKIIIHRLTKPSPSTPCQIQLRPGPVSASGEAQELCREVRNTILRKAGKMYGCLSDDAAEAPLKPLLMQWLEEKMGFQSFSEAILNQLKAVLDGLDGAFDQHVLIFFEQIEAGDALYIALLDHCGGHCLDGELELCATQYLDTQNIPLAAKIKIPELLENQQHNYLSICRWRGEKDLSDAFADAIGFANKVDVAADTSQFLELVTHYTQKLPSEQANDTRSQVVEYCLEQDKAGKEVSVQELSQHISAEREQPFVDYVSSMQPQVTKPFIADKTQLRNYVRISGRNEQLSMSFASECLGQSVTYDAQSDTITIKDIPAGLKSKLIQHMRAQQNQAEENV